jgi:hypothetical protein
VIAIVLASIALAVSLAPHVKRLVTRKRTTVITLGDAFGHESPRARAHAQAAKAWGRVAEAVKP